MRTRFYAVAMRVEQQEESPPCPGAPFVSETVVQVSQITLAGKTIQGPGLLCAPAPNLHSVASAPPRRLL